MGLGSSFGTGTDRVLETLFAFKAALALLEAGESEALIFTKVDRASRCTEDFARLIRLSEEQDWLLIVTEMGIDTRTPMGKAMAHLAVVFAELERDDVVARIVRAHGGQDRVRHCPRPEQGHCADCAGRARLVPVADPGYSQNG